MGGPWYCPSHQDSTRSQRAGLLMCFMLTRTGVCMQVQPIAPTHLSRAGLGEHGVTPQNCGHHPWLCCSVREIYNLVNFCGERLRYKGPSNFTPFCECFTSSLRPSVRTVYFRNGNPASQFGPDRVLSVCVCVCVSSCSSTNCYHGSRSWFLLLISLFLPFLLHCPILAKPARMSHCARPSGGSLSYNKLCFVLAPLASGFAIS